MEINNEKDQPNKPAVIMVVDDNQQNLELLQAYLEDIDCRTISAEDGIEALELIAKDAPDLILLDVMMPKMSGFEVCKRLKADPKTTDIPVIMVTALTEFGDIERAIDSGTDDFVSKPVNKLELLIRVRTMTSGIILRKWSSFLKNTKAPLPCRKKEVLS